MVVGMIASLLQYQWASNRQAVMQQVLFEQRVDDVADALKRTLSGNAQVLYGVNGLFASSEFVSREEFKSFYDQLRLERNFPGIQGIGFSKWLMPSELENYTQKIRAEGFPNFSVRPSGVRENYSSISYLEPFDWRNQRAFGFDMFSESNRRTAMRASVESNAPALSDKVTLVQETQTAVQAGVLIYIPVYKKNMPTETSEDRWRALFGWAYSPLRAKDLVDSMLEIEFKVLRDELNLRIFSSSVQDWGKLLYQTESVDLPEQGLVAHTKTIDVYGQKWLVAASPQKGYWHDREREKDFRFMLVASLSFSLIIGLFLNLLARRNLRLAGALSESVRAKQQLEENAVSLRLAGVVMEVSPTGIFVADNARRIIAVNPSFTLITGFSEAQVLGQQVDFLLSKHAVIESGTSIWDDLDTNGRWKGELSFRRADGSLYPNDVSITLVDYKEGQGTQFVGMFTDISARRKDEERIRFLAHHDFLTGLPNRALFVDRAEQALLGALRYGLKPVLIFIDLDRFKPINDEYGHDVGDAVLKHIAQRLQDQVRQSDFVCRQGGDEFVIMLPDHTDNDIVMALAEQLLTVIEEPYKVKALTLNLSASMGIAIYPVHGKTLDQLIQSADAAMYQAKADKQQRIRMASSG